ncbi:MAG TPA: hypothetical protein VFX52_07500 [Nocardioidaceae bacterium]|nr:hypothetical protein [Nocardioidaceae bacterium]
MLTEADAAGVLGALSARRAMTELDAARALRREASAPAPRPLDGTQTRPTRATMPTVAEPRPAAADRLTTA